MEQGHPRHDERARGRFGHSVRLVDPKDVIKAPWGVEKDLHRPIENAAEQADQYLNLRSVLILDHILTNTRSLMDHLSDCIPKFRGHLEVHDGKIKRKRC